MERDTQQTGGGGAANATGFDRISHDPRIMGGKPIIRGMRVTVGMIVGQIGAGVTIDELLEGYPYLEREDILQALRYGDRLGQGRDSDPTAH
jgi:uncharacterized protein (DUF433 family)